jgi:hypothetical protein
VAAVSEISPAVKACCNQALAAGLVFEAKVKEYEAAIYNGTKGEAARDTCHAAFDALLDSRERFLRAIMESQR